MSAVFVVAASVASAWLSDVALASASFAVFTALYLFVFWKWLADATDRRALAHLKDCLG